MATNASLWHAPFAPLLRSQKYELSLATTLAEVQACQRLRYAVFNIELGEGLDSSHSLGLDRDHFDVICDHLMVTEARTAQVVGTYRLQTGYRAKGNAGYYSEGFFEFRPYEAIRAQLLELGRACIHPEHRHSAVLMLLWKGIFQYARRYGVRFLVGCSSLTSQNPAEGWAMYELLRKNYLASPPYRTLPAPGHGLPYCVAHPDPPPVPKLLATYLELSASICGPPAIDLEFKTIDFLTFLDLNKIPAPLRRRLRSGVTFSE
jgi:putative hemolysin